METSALKFQQAYDDARAASIASLASVKDVYEGISRDLTSEFKALEGEKRDLAGGLLRTTTRPHNGARHTVRVVPGYSHIRADSVRGGVLQTVVRACVLRPEFGFSCIQVSVESCTLQVYRGPRTNAQRDTITTYLQGGCSCRRADSVRGGQTVV